MNNLARDKFAVQSSFDREAKFACDSVVDINFIGSIYPCSYTKIQDSEPAWWSVDLEKIYLIKSVDILNRQTEPYGWFNIFL